MAPLERILCVEDDPDIQVVLRLGLEVGGGFTLRLCDSKRDAVAIATAFRPHLAVISMDMAGMDGAGTLAALRQTSENAQLPGLLMTNKGRDTESAIRLHPGVLGVIGKSLNSMDLVWEVHNHWLRHHGANSDEANASPADGSVGGTCGHELASALPRGRSARGVFGSR